MNKYIFLTFEGYTYQPIIDDGEDAGDIENCQVIGFSEGEDPKEALNKLLIDKHYLENTTLDHIYCYKLDNDYRKNRADFYLDDIYNRRV